MYRAFKTYTMESVHGYLTNLRMQHCRRAIAAGASVLDACNASGFTNYTSFLKTFRSLYGITPSEYRNQLRRTPEQVLYPINNVSRPISSLGQLFSQINLKKAQKQAHQSQSSFQSVLGFDERSYSRKATPHNSRLTGLSTDPASAVPRSPYRHLELCGIALTQTPAVFVEIDHIFDFSDTPLRKKEG